MTQARIYQKLKNAMQSGRAGTDVWILEFVSSETQRADPLMGWAGSHDTLRQLMLKFPTLEAAKVYATNKNIDAHVIAPPTKTLKIQAYADNFR